MLDRPPVYGLDVIVQPHLHAIVAAAVSTVDGEEYFDGPEWRILASLDQRLRRLKPGVIATWNGSVLDLPNLRSRAVAWRQQRHLELCWIYDEDLTTGDQHAQDPRRGAQMARSLTERRVNTAQTKHWDDLADSLWADLGEDYPQPVRVDVPDEVVRRHPAAASVQRLTS